MPGVVLLAGRGVAGAADGAEGSPVEHGDGCPSGLRDTSLLTLFADHVAYSIWHGEVF